MRIHTDELDIDDALVGQLVVEQFPDWAELPLERAGDGTVNVIYRLGDELALRLPRRDGNEAPDDREARILSALATCLPVDIPRPVAPATVPARAIRGSGRCTRGWRERFPTGRCRPRRSRR
jgi:aminoglycoside phosphotransferase (APT) family kinase protein